MADLRRCIGSARFGIVAHDAPPEAFPTQPSQKDGLGRMCRPHWNQYTSTLRKAALAHQAADGGVASKVAPIAARKGVGGRSAREAKVAKPEPIRTRVPRGRRQAETVAEVAQEPAAG